MIEEKDGQVKSFVRSIRVKIDDVVPGMVLAEEVRTPGGAIIIAADTFLTREHLERQKECGINHLYIEACDIPKEFDPLRGKTAIVVDDSLFFRHMFAKMLYRMGMLVCDEVGTAEECLRAADRYKPDLIVMDIHLPKMDGRAAMRKLRPKLPSARFLAVSSDKERQTIIEAFKSGANDFIAKPIIWETLKPRVLKLFSQSDGIKSLTANRPLAP
jgi:two-component system, chemotaxis family, chemotaxis protein CheY